MDSLTHIVLGACIGEVFVGKRIGKWALLFGAVAQSIPDIDFIGSFYLQPADDLLAHRSFTHSFLFALLVVPLLAYIAGKLLKQPDVSFKRWTFFFAVEILTHLLLDTANVYGTGLLEPFSHLRFSYNTMFVADPLFSIVPAIVVIALLINKSSKKRAHWAYFSILWCSFYLLLGLVNKFIIESAIKQNTAEKNIVYQRHFSTPTPFNNLLWYVVLENDKGYYIGYRSVFNKDKPINFTYIKRNDSLLNDLKERHDIKQLKLFSQNYYAVEKTHDTLIFNDLRFGQVTGWNNSSAAFTFYYYVNYPKDNDLLIQRGRFKNWNNQTIATLWKRMLGN